MNFIGDLDLLLEQEKKEVKKRFGDNSINKNFGLDRYLEVSYGDKKYNFLIRKNEKTRFHINMNNVRVYLSDFDILELLIDNFPNHGNEIINEIINFLNSKFDVDPEICFESERGTIQRMIGMTLYLFSAAGFMRIKKGETYNEDKKVT